ncbi:RraA family protein [Nocardioides sp.]|uniref:RraA family protein n=1 Tax=Nocardioides sp. TaxID=35761 RepID=UPI003D0EE953
MTPVSPALLSELRELGSATVHEAQGRCGELDPAIKPIEASWAIAGPAFPVVTPGGSNAYIHDAIYAAPEGAVLVVDTCGARDFGYWGDIMSTAASQRRLGGLVIDGCVRDADGLVGTGLPVFARGLSIRGTHKVRDLSGRVGEPASVAGQLVRAGDIVIGDRDGLVLVPRESVEHVCAAAHARHDKEEAIMSRLRAGERTLDIFDLVERGAR